MGRPKKVTLDEILAKVHPTIHKRVREMYFTAGVDGVMLFEQLEIAPGREETLRSVLMFGPRCSNNFESASTGHLGDVPSRFQYPTLYCLKENGHGRKR
jgi:hypothetical protein